MLTIVMYHYVRDLPRTRYPRIKGLHVTDFDGQLDYICKHYTVCGFRDLLTAISGDAELPERPCILTFDDGLLDHYVNVFPRLLARGLVGSFYPPAQAIDSRRILDVHKIHLILASVREPRILANEILDLVTDYPNPPHPLPHGAALYQRFAQYSRQDPPEVVFVKRILQRGLPDVMRTQIIDQLFQRHVDVDEATLAGELYMDIHQLRTMLQSGMEVGGHGYTHPWLDSLSREDQQREITATAEFLGRVYGHPPKRWTMCYPHGGYNEITTDLLHGTDAAFGLTTHRGLVSDLSRPFDFARLDTNELPSTGDAPIAKWTQLAT